MLVSAVAVSRAVAFQNHYSCQRQQQRLQDREARSSPSLFTVYSNLGDQSTEAEDENRILSPPFIISRRSAASSMATTAASILFSAPAIALAEEEGATAPITETSPTPTTPKIEDPVFDAPVEKEKTIEYTVQDFTMALPANWKIITKYDGKSTTPTIFSAIDFNSGAVLSVVREEPCTVADYAKSSFEKSTKTAKKCDFAFKPADGGNPMKLFSSETYEKDASKLLIRHDDRDNAVLSAISKVNDSKLVGKGGLLMLPTHGDEDSTRIDSFSSPLLELSATTTIPTSGTYTDTMGLEQPNTIQRKVVAKAVATTTKITTEIAPPPSSEPNLPSTESVTTSTGTEGVASPTPTVVESKEGGSVASAAPSSSNTALEADKNTASAPPVGAATTNTAKVSVPSDVAGIPGLDPPQSLETDSIKTSMMAMVATIDEQLNSAQTATAESPKSSLSEDEIQKAVEAAMEKAMASAIEAVKDNSIEPTIEAVTEKAKATAKEMALEILSANKTTAKDESSPDMKVVIASTSDASAIDSIPKDEAMTSISLAENPVTDELPALPKTTTTTTTSVLSIWLSAPMDEWQKPAMGTRLNQIWDSVQYTSDIIEGTDNIDLLSQDDDELNARLLLMNKQAILR